MKVVSVDGKFEMIIRVNKVDKGVLFIVLNLYYEELISKYFYLEGVVMEDNNKKSELFIRFIFGISEYSRIKIEIKLRIGKLFEIIVEFITLGWAMMFFGKEIGFFNVYLIKLLVVDYE